MRYSRQAICFEVKEDKFTLLFSHDMPPAAPEGAIVDDTASVELTWVDQGPGISFDRKGLGDQTTAFERCRPASSLFP